MTFVSVSGIVLLLFLQKRRFSGVMARGERPMSMELCNRGHNGTLQVKSEPEVGPVFRVLFPAVDRVAPEAPRNLLGAAGDQEEFCGCRGSSEPVPKGWTFSGTPARRCRSKPERRCG
jgi:hypothetical protein